MLKVHRISSIEWNPSGVVALATSADGSQVAAARADGSLEIWLVSPGSVGWHCQLTIHGDPNSRVSSLVWCRSGPRGGPLGRLLSSSIDGSVSEWDLFDLRQKKVLDSIGVSIWQMAAEPFNELQINVNQEINFFENGNDGFSITTGDSDEEASESEDEDNEDVVEIHGQNCAKDTRLAIACDDGCLRFYSVSDEEKLTYNKTLPRVSGRTLSVTWSSDAKRVYSGSSDGAVSQSIDTKKYGSTHSNPKHTKLEKVAEAHSNSKHTEVRGKKKVKKTEAHLLCRCWVCCLGASVNVVAR